MKRFALAAFALLAAWPAAAQAHTDGGCVVGRWQPVGSLGRSLAVESGQSGVDARSAPNAHAPLLRHFAYLTAEGVTQVFLVKASILGRDCHATWYRVDLPLRPNGHTGYIHAAGLTPYVVSSRIVISVGARRLQLYMHNRLRLTLPVAVGRPGAPTPTGSFYVQEKLLERDSSGAYGPGALGLSAYSPTLTDWVRGGPVAIHGTDDPTSVGHPVSHGCIRVINTSMRLLLKLVTPGAPVQILP